MRYTVPLVVALAASVSAAVPKAPIEQRADKLFTLEIAPGETVEVTEDEKFQMIDVGHQVQFRPYEDCQQLTISRITFTSLISPSGRIISLPQPLVSFQLLLPTLARSSTSPTLRRSSRMWTSRRLRGS